jgi:hypothetical protein
MSKALGHKSWRYLAAMAAIFVLHSSTALAAGTPVINSEAPDNFALNTARFHGTVDPNGGTGTTYKVEYGRTKLYGQSTPSLSVSGAGAVPVEVALVGLQPMSTYHYRVSATNSVGTTVTSDGLFETLLSWKVEGKRVSELEAVSFEDEFSKLGEGGAAEFRGATLGGTAVRVYCRQGEHVSGILDAQYSNLVFDQGCFTQLGLTKSTPCKPLNGITLHLNGFLGQVSSTTVQFGEECSIGESLIFANGGYTPYISGSEATKYTGRMQGTSYALGRAWEAAFSNYTTTTSGAWKLTGPNAGKVFGIS